MRFVLFYSGVESFNYFTDEITAELKRRGHECHIHDLRCEGEKKKAEYGCLSEFLTQPVDCVIAFDGLGIKDELFIRLWDSCKAAAVNILMDHPLRFHPTMCRHPERYIQFCCDKNHVEYVKKYFKNEVDNVFFMPHAGTDVGRPKLSDYEGRPYDVLFCGTYYKPETYLTRIDNDFSQNEFLREFYRRLFEYMSANISCTTEDAVTALIRSYGIAVNDSLLKTMLGCAETVDWMVRMYYREKVISAIAEDGIELWLLGRGFENHPAAGLKNVHIISDRVPFAQTFKHMAAARINLNVMPWFKNGTHDRVFNILLEGSLPVTDTSIWLKDNFTDGEDIVFYDLSELNRLPGTIRHYLSDTEDAKNIIRCGYEKVSSAFTWNSCVDTILSKLEGCF